jgi:hypothetical protein
VRLLPPLFCSVTLVPLARPVTDPPNVNVDGACES